MIDERTDAVPVSMLPRGRAPLVRLAVFAVVLSAFFAPQLIDWAKYGAKSSLHSHTLLVPLISLYLVRQKWRGTGEKRGLGNRGQTTGDTGQGVRTGKKRERAAVASGAQAKDRLGNPTPHDRLLHALPATIGFMAASAVLALYFLLTRGGWTPQRNDYLFFTILSYVSLLVSGGYLFLGTQVMNALAFPWLFLLFMVPLPTAAIDGIEVFFQYASAEAANLFFAIGPTPYLRDGLSFDLPGISLQVAQECSGIRSSLVLFMTALLAGHMFLRSGWKRALLALGVIPLGILRNGFRVFTIGMLCVHVDVGMIDSPVHRSGGPIFFALSLVPFVWLLWWLRRSEHQHRSLHNA